MTSFNSSKWLIRCYHGTCSITLSPNSGWSVGIRISGQVRSTPYWIFCTLKEFSEIYDPLTMISTILVKCITFCTRILLEEAKRHHPKGTVEWTMVVTWWYSVVRMAPSPYYLFTVLNQLAMGDNRNPRKVIYNQSGWIFSRIRTFRFPYRIQSTTAYSTPYHY